MEHAFPYRFEPQESGGVLAQFIDVPEAHSFGPTEAKAGGDTALDCLIAALGGYIKLGREIPAPSLARGRPVVILPPLVAAKLALYGAMRAERITRTALARQLGLQTACATCTSITAGASIRLTVALAALGKRLEVRVLDPA